MSLTKVSYSMINGAPVNVLDFGAVGDATTDDTVAIQNAINAAAVTGADIYLPPGKYVVTDTLTIPIHGAGTVGEQHGTGKIYGAGRNSFSPEGPGTAAYWGTQIVALNLGGKPLFYATQSRYFQLQDIQLFGPGLAVANSIGIHFDNQNSQWSLINVGMQDFYSCIQLGKPGNTPYNDDFGTIDRCYFDYATICINSYTTETFQTRMMNSSIGDNVQFGYFAQFDGVGTTAASFKAWGTYFGCWDTVIQMNIEARDGVHIYTSHFECNKVGLTSPPTMFYLDSATGFSQSPITFESCYVNYNFGAAYGNSLKPLIYMYGQGPLNFKHNKIQHANPRVQVQAFIPDICSGTFEGNIWQYAPIYTKVTNTQFAEIICQNEVIQYAGYTGPTDPGTTSANFVGTCGRTSYGGRTVQYDTLQPGGSVIAGSIIYGSEPSSSAPTIKTAIYGGTNGTLSGVTGSISSGSNSLSVNTSVGLYVGAFISIAGVTTPFGGFKVLSLWNNVVTLNANADATVSSAAVSYSAPLYRNVNIYTNAAPTTGAWNVGDIAYNSSPTAGGYIGWVCTVAGTPGTWKTFGAISP